MGLYLVGGIVPPWCQQPVAVLVHDEGRELVLLAAVFQAVLIVREDVDEIVAAVIAPGCCPMACAAGVVIGVLAIATIAAFEIAGRVDDETGVALTSPTAWPAMPTISLMVGTPVGANLTLGRRIYSISHFALTRVSPHSES
jgi:hypothetical protein